MYRTNLVPNTKYLYGLIKFPTQDTKETKETRINNNPRVFVHQRKEQFYVSNSSVLLQLSSTIL